MIAVLYHKGCVDGFTAAWVASLKLGRGPHVEYVPVRYGDPVPPVAWGADTVLLLDFSYPRALVEKLAGPLGRRRVMVFDHHKTTVAELVDFEGADLVLDLERSGARITWDQLFPGQPPPRLVEYVDDNDLYRHALLESRAIAAWLRSWKFSFATWAGLAHELGYEGTFHAAIMQGRAILRAMEREVAAACRQARLEPWNVGTPHDISQPHVVEAAVVNSAHFPSEIGERLCQTPGAAFAAVYHDRADGIRQWHLRSANGFDVSAVAKARGGGGHAAAAGFEERLN